MSFGAAHNLEPGSVVLTQVYGRDGVGMLTTGGWEVVFIVATSPKTGTTFVVCTKEMGWLNDFNLVPPGCTILARPE